MADEVVLTGIDGTNPLGFLAALGTISALDRMVGPQASLRWTKTVVPRPVIRSIGPLDDLVARIDEDRQQWLEAALLNHPGLDDVKLRQSQARGLMQICRDSREPRSAALAAALLAEGSYDNNGATKPTDLHFTAGQQKFMTMIRTLAAGVDPDAIRRALVGPWEFDSALPSLGWEISDDRVYALAASDPSKTKKLSEPGAEWLGFCGLALAPVARRDDGTLTSGGSGSWKRGAWTWSLWEAPCSARVAQQMAFTSPATRARPHGIFQSVTCNIRRSDQGGYGSFGPPTVEEVG